MKIHAVAVFSALFIVGCAAPRPIVLQTQFVAAEHDVYKQSGAGSIKGQGFLRQRGGGTVTCAGSEVFLIPASPYFREVVGYIVKGRRMTLTDKLDSAYRSIIRISQCDAQGNFSFAKLPMGPWFLSTDVTWRAANEEQGGTLLSEVTTSSEEPVQVILTNSALIPR